MKIGILLIGFNRLENIVEVHATAAAHGGGLPIVVHIDGAEAGSRHYEGNQRVRGLGERWLADGQISSLKCQSSNLGCKYGPPAAISWALSLFDAAIILEDDCVPDPTFFRYCVELLRRYDDDLRVGSVCGDNAYGLDFSDIPYSYCFISYPRIWGWATWRNRWARYDADRTQEKAMACAYGYWPQLNGSSGEERRMRKALAEIDSGRVANWDTQWWSCFMANHWLCAQPCTNLIKNTGFGPDATHTTNSQSTFATLRIQPLSFPLLHPEFVRPERELDSALARQYGPWARIKRLARRFF